MAKDEARVTVLGVPDRPGAALSIFSKVAARNIAMDMIVQNEGADGRADLSFMVPREELPSTLRAVNAAVKELGAEGCDYDENVAKISVVGLGMATTPGVAGEMFLALAEKGINIHMITTSEIKISVVVAREFARKPCGPFTRRSSCTPPLPPRPAMPPELPRPGPIPSPKGWSPGSSGWKS